MPLDEKTKEIQVVIDVTRVFQTNRIEATKGREKASAREATSMRVRTSNNAVSGIRKSIITEKRVSAMLEIDDR